MPKPFPVKNYINFLSIFLAISLSNCKEINNSKESTEFAQTDSIRIWIDQSKIQNTPLEIKSHFLEKAQNNTSSLRNDSHKSQYLKELSLLYYRLNDSLNFRKVNRKAIQITKNIKDSANLGEVYWDLGAFFNRYSIHDSAYFQYTKAQKVFENIDNQFLSGRLLYNMARTQSQIGDYTGSEITTIKAIEKLKPLSKYEELYKCYNLLADNAKLLNEPERALAHYNESLVYLKKANLRGVREQSWKNNVGLVYQKQGQNDKAITLFSEVLAFDGLRQKNPRLYGRTLNNLAYSYLKINKMQETPSLLHQAIKLQDSINDINGKCSSAARLSEYFLSQKDTSTALTYLESAKEMAIVVGDNKQLLKILRVFPRVDPKNAAVYTQQYVTLNDSLQMEERRIRNKFARIQFETDEFIAENQVLAREKQLWTGIAASVILLGLASFIIINQRVKNRILKFRQEQQANNQEIFNLMLAQGEKVEEGKKLEQKRVSEELHDGVLGKMLGARMMLLGLNKKTDPEAIAERAKAISIIQDVEGEVRSISHELSHAAYQKIHNFILSIKDLISTVKGVSEINFDFRYSDELDWDALSGDIKINLYRIIQESIQNSVKHAACENIYMNFDADEAILTIQIEDDGKGFTVKKGKKGIGMRNIASRMEKINGTWDIKSELGKGTKVTLRTPLISNDNENAPSILQLKHNLQET